MDAAIDRLTALALAWESTGGLRALTGVADGLTGGPEHGVSGLQPMTDPPPTTASVAESLAALSDPARAMLQHVVASGGEATTGSARVTVLPADAATPAEELLSRRLLVPRTGSTAIVPGEVGVAVRAGHTTAERVDAVPALATASRDGAMVDRAAAGAAFEAVRRLELLLDAWGARPPSALRSGGLGVRDLRATAAALHLDESDRRTARRDRGERRSGHDGRRRRRQPGVAADRPLRQLGAAPGRRTLGRAGPGLARQSPDARAGGHSRPGRQDLERARSRARGPAHARDPADDPRGPGRPPPGRGARRRDRRPLGGGPARLAAAATATAARRAGALDAHRSGGAGDDRARRPGVVRPAAARRRRRGSDEGVSPLCCPSPSSTCCCRPTSPRSRRVPLESAAGPEAPARRGGRVAWRRRRLPLLARLGPPGAGSRLDGDRAARVPGLGVANAGAAAAGLPRRRHGPHLRHRPGRARRGLRTRRRRDRADRAPAPLRSPPGSACAGSRRPC